jgi:hypothetical protein
MMRTRLLHSIDALLTWLMAPGAGEPRPFPLTDAEYTRVTHWYESPASRTRPLLITRG